MILEMFSLQPLLLRIEKLLQAQTTFDAAFLSFQNESNEAEIESKKLRDALLNARMV